MPALKSRVVLNIARGLKAFLSLDVGVTRGEVSISERQIKDQSRQLTRAQRELQKNDQTLQAPARRKASKEIKTGKNQEWHRRQIGGRWDEIGDLQFDFLRDQGLQPHHRLLDVGCGSLRGGVRFIRYLDPGHYYGIDRSQELLDAGWGEIEAAGLQDRRPTLVQVEDFGFERLDQTFDYALAQSVFTHLPLNLIARCLVNVDRVLNPGGVFFATFFENREGKQYLEPLEQGDGIVSYYDENPYHYNRMHSSGLVRKPR